MTGRQGGKRSVSFPIARRAAAVSSRTDPAEVGHPILIWRNLIEDNAVIFEKIERLGVDPNGMHGDLQVVRSALKRMEHGVDKLIAMEQGEPAQ